MIVQLVGGEFNGETLLFDSPPWEHPAILHKGKTYYLRYQMYKQLNWYYIFYLHL